MPRGRLLFIALLPLLISAAAVAQSPAAGSEPVTTGSPRVTPPPAAPVAQPVPMQPPQPGAAPGPRRPRSYEQCRQTAFQRHLRGAERRHYMTRCQLGYGRPLFRRRGRGAPGAVPAPAPAPQGHRPAPT